MTQGTGVKPKDEIEKAQHIESKIDAIVTFMRIGMSVTSAARAAGLHVNTYFNWQKWAKEGIEPYASLWHKIRKARGEGEVMLVSRIHNASEKDWKAAAWILERSYKKGWSTKVENDVKVSGNINHNVSESISNMTEEQRLARIKELEDKLLKCSKEEQ